MAAPTATASSGFTALLGCLPKISCTVSCTLGIRVMPPTSSTSPMSVRLTSPSDIAFLQGSTVRRIKSPTRPSNLERESLRVMCFGPD
uniref:Putative secreted protein n=1 Tax=Ixodes ricinus TaxID=34613 RepID=A0A6B0TZI7_IXORI